MSLRKTGTCEQCGKPLYGDEYGAAGHKCEEAFTEECECSASSIVLAWYTEARILIRLDPTPESKEGKRLIQLVGILQEYEKALLELKE